MSEETAKMKIILISGLQSLTTGLSRALGEARLLSPEDFCASPAAHDGETNYIYIPIPADSDGMMPDQNEAQRVFQHAAQAGGRQFILLSSALIYGTGPGRQALVKATSLAVTNSALPLELMLTVLYVWLYRV